jgi:FHA domain
LAFVGRLVHRFRALRGLLGGSSRALAGARSAELQGELESAIALFERGGRADEAVRVRRSRALAALAATSEPVTSSARQALAALAAELESLGEFERAAEAYARARDLDGQARALGSAGDVDHLDELLTVRHARAHEALALRGAHDLFEMLVASGKRREAVLLARGSTDAGLRSRGRAVDAKRVTGPVVRAAVRGHVKTLVLGERVAIGRTRTERVGEGVRERVGVRGADDDDGVTATIPVTSAAVSRRHLSIVRREGDVWVRDLGSHNGTTLRGAALAGDVAVGDGVELRLGDEVPLVVRPADDWPGAITVEVSGSRYLAPLGPARLGPGAWRLEWSRASAVEGDDETWVELVTGEGSPAYSGGLQLAERVTLLFGDAIAATRSGEAVLALLGPET